MSTSWPAWCVNVHINAVQLANIFMLLPAAKFPDNAHPTWRELYLQALFEPDLSKTAFRIREAERALKLREQELFAGPNHNNKDEREAVNVAQHALHALKLSLLSRAKSRAA